jgi:hypothetical protein
MDFGAVAERLKATVLKTVVRVSGPGVRIPPAPLPFCHIVLKALKPVPSKRFKIVSMATEGIP